MRDLHATYKTIKIDIKTKLYVTKVTLNRNNPAYVAIYILDLSKELMHEFHYDYIKSKF